MSRPMLTAAAAQAGTREIVVDEAEDRTTRAHVTNGNVERIAGGRRGQESDGTSRLGGRSGARLSQRGGRKHRERYSE